MAIPFGSVNREANIGPVPPSLLRPLWHRSRRRRPAPSRKVVFEALEPRLLLNAEPFSVALADFADEDEFTLFVTEVDDVSSFAIVDSDDDVLASQAVDDTSAINITGKATRDELTIDFTGFAPIDEFEGIDFQAGGGEDELKLAGPAAAVTNSVAGPDSGELLRNALSVTYAGLESISIDFTATDLSHIASDADDEIEIAAETASRSKITSNGTFADLFFQNPTGTLLVEPGGGGDAVDAADYDGDVTLAFTDDWGDDTLVTNDSTTLDFSDYAGVVEAELTKTGTLTITGRLSDVVSTLTIEDVDIAALTLVGAEFEPDNIIGAIDALQDDIAELIDSLKQLEEEGPFGAALPLATQLVSAVIDDQTIEEVFEASLGRALQLVTLLEELQEHVEGFASTLSGGPLSLQLAQHLVGWEETFGADPDDELAPDFGDLTVGFNAVRLLPKLSGSEVDELVVELDFFAENTSTFSLDFGRDAAFFGIRFEAPAIELAGRVDAILPFGIAGLAGTSQSLFIGGSLDLALEVNVNAQNLQFDVSLGFLDASISGNLDATVAATAGHADPENPGTLQVTGITSALLIDLDFRINVGLFKNEDVFGTASGGFASGTLVLSFDDVFSGQAPDIQANVTIGSTEIDLLQFFGTTGPGDVFGMLEQLKSYLEQLSVSDALTLPIPFSGKRLGELLPFAQSIEETLLDPLVEGAADELRYLYTGAQSMAQKLLDDATAAGFDISLDFQLPDDAEGTPAQLLFSIGWSKVFTTFDLFGVDGVPLSFSFDLGDLGNIKVRPVDEDGTDPSLTLDVALDFDFTFGIELAPQPELLLGLPLFVPNLPTEARRKGRLSDDATFDVQLYDRLKLENDSDTPEFKLAPLVSGGLSVTVDADATNIAPGAILLRSQATGGTATTLADTSADFTDLLSGVTSLASENVFVRIVSGDGAGQLRKITASTATTVTVVSNWQTTPTSSSRYEIVTGLRVLRGEATGGSSTTLVDADAKFTDRLDLEHGTYFVEIVDGTGRGQVRQITNATTTATTLTVAAWTTTPDATSRYQIFLGDPQKTLQHDVQRAVNDALADATRNTPDNGDPETLLRPGDINVDWTGTRFTFDAPATMLETEDDETGIVEVEIYDRVLAFQAFNGVTKDELGLLSSPLRFDGQLRDGGGTLRDATFIVNVDGDEHEITVSGAATGSNTSIDDLVEQLNAALTAEGITDAEFVRQSLNGFADGNRLALKGQSVGRLELRPVDPEDVDPLTSENAAVFALGITETVTARGLATEFFIQGAVDEETDETGSAGFSASVALAVDELVLEATLGFLGVEVELTGDNEITAALGLGIVDPESGGGRVAIPTLWKELSSGHFLHNSDDGTGFLLPSLDFDGHLGLTARPLGLPPELLSAIEAFLGADLEIAVDLSFGLTEEAPQTEPNGDDFGRFVHAIELGQVSALDLGFLVIEAEIDTSLIDGLQDLLGSFRNLSFADIIALINQAANFVADLDGPLGDVAGDILSFQLPLVNQSLGDLLDFAEEFSRYAEGVLENPAASIQEVENLLREGLGLPGRDPDGSLPASGQSIFDLALGFDAGDPENDIDSALRLDLEFGFGFDESLPIDLDVIQLIELAAGGPVNLGDFSLTNLLALSASGGLGLSGGGKLALALGLPLISDPAATLEQRLPFLYRGEDGTRLDFDLTLTGSDLAFEARVQTLGVFVRDGSGELTAEFSLHLAGADGDRIDFESLIEEFGDLITPSFGGHAELELPIYFPTENRQQLVLQAEIPSLARLANHFIPSLDLPLENGVDPDGPLVTLSPTLDELLASFTFQPPSLLDLLLDPRILVDGVNTGLDYLEDALRGQILGIDLPLIGDALAPAATFISDFRGQFLTPLASQIYAGLEGYDSTAHALQDILYRIFGHSGGDIEKISAFGKEFGELGLLLSQEAGSPRAPGGRGDVMVSGRFDSDSDGELTENTAAEHIQFDIILGSTLAELTLPAGFDIGIPGLGLEFDADINLVIDWELMFGFGIDATDGFYLVTYPDDDSLRLTAEAFLTGTGDGQAGIKGTLGFLQLTATDHEGADRTGLEATFAIDLQDPGVGAQADNRITFRELVSKSTKLTDVVKAKLDGSAHIGLAVTVDFGGFEDLDIAIPVSSLPSVDFDFVLDWGLGTDDLFGSGLKLDTVPQINLNDITVDLGSFISDFAGPVLDVFAEILSPLEWLIGPDGLLNKRIPLLSDLAGTTITLKTLAEAFDQQAKITPFISFAEEVYGLIKIIDAARQQAAAGNIGLNFGSIDLNALFQQQNGGSENGFALPSLSKDGIESYANQVGNTLDQTLQDVDFSGSQSSKRFTNTLTKGKAAFHFPILEPATIFSLILGGDVVDLIQIDVPELVFAFDYRQVFHIFGPLAATLRGSFAATLDLGIGYDTLGIQNFRASENFLDVLDGLYFSTVDFESGARNPALTLRGEIAAGASLSLGVATAGVEGGIGATIYFDWNDPDQDTKVRLKEMLGNIEFNFPDLGPAAVLSVFDITGVIDWFLKAFIEVNLFFFKYSNSLDLGGGVIAEFEIPFKRAPLLASQAGDTVTLHIGPSAHSRLNGEIRDIGETIVARSSNFNAETGKGTVEVWSSQFGVGEGSFSKRTFNGVSKIVAHGGEGNDFIDLSRVTHALELDVDGGAGNDRIIVGNGFGRISGGSGNDEIEILDGTFEVDGGLGFDTIKSVSTGSHVSTGEGGGIIEVAGGGPNEFMHVAGAGENFFDTRAAGADTTHRYVFGEEDGPMNAVVLGGTATGVKNILDFSAVRQNLVVTLEEGTASYGSTTSTSGHQIVVTYGENNRVVADGTIDLILGGRGGDSFHAFATRADGVTLDGGEGPDTYFAYAWDPTRDGGTAPPSLDVRLRDTGTDAWNNDEVFVIGSADGDDITVRDDTVTLSYGSVSQTITYNNPNAEIFQLTVLDDVADFADEALPAGIARLYVQGKGGDDLIKVLASPANMSVFIQGEDDDDTIVLGSEVAGELLTEATDGNIDAILANGDLGGFRVAGGLGQNRLIIDDSGNPTGKNEHGDSDDRGTLQRSAVQLGWLELDGLGMGTDVLFTEIADFEVRLGLGDDRFDLIETRDDTGEEIIETVTLYGGGGDDLLNLYSAEPETTLALYGDFGVSDLAEHNAPAADPGSADIINIFGTRGETFVFGGPGGDGINVHAIAAETEIFGGRGDDRVHVGVLIDPVTGYLIDSRTEDLLLEEENGFVLDPAATLDLIDPRTGFRVDADLNTMEENGQPVVGDVARNVATPIFEEPGQGRSVLVDYLPLYLWTGEDPPVATTESRSANRIEAELTLNGQDGGDRYNVWFGGEGQSLINVFDTGQTGGDFLHVFGSEDDDVYLMRAGISSANDIGLGQTGRIAFVALLNDGRESTAEEVERINYARDTDANTGINGGFIVEGMGGFDEFYVDDNLGPTQLIGATGGNYFQFGQLYNSPRADNLFANIAFEDEFETLETTRGWLSNGTSFDLTALGAEDASNEFVVLNNQGTLNLFGGDRNDRFIVRSFALVGSVDPQRKNIDISTGGGENYVEYVVGAPVNIDGGGGFNTLVVIGTEFADDYVITEDGIFGSGRLVNFVNIQQLEVDGAEGKDRFFIQGTAPGTAAVLSGGLGSDAFFVGGQAPDIISRDLKGHSGKISHSATSLDPTWDGLRVDEISANVADNDEHGIVVTQSGGRTVVVEGALIDTYTIVLTKEPDDDVTITATVPQRPVTVNDKRQLRPLAYVSDAEAGDFEETVELVFTGGVGGNWRTPQTVFVKVAEDQPHTGIVTGYIGHDVAGEKITGTTTTALRFTGELAPNQLIDTAASFTTEGDGLRGATVRITDGPGKGQSRTVVGNTATTLTLDKAWTLDPVTEQSTYEIRLTEGLPIPSVLVKAYRADVGAAFIEPGGGLEVIEQANGVDFDAPQPFVAEYQVVLTADPGASGATVSIAPGDGLVTDQPSLSFTPANWQTPQTVKVAIAADGIVQKPRLLEIGHSIGGADLESVLVRVIDGDSPTVVVTEFEGSTNVIEGGVHSDGAPFIDAYGIVLSQQPDENVQIVVRAEGTRTSKGNVVNFGDQVLVAQGPTSDASFVKEITLTFTPDNWNTPQIVTVKAIDDQVVDGGDTKVFGRRADDTSRIQGPLEIRGGGGQGSLVGLPIAVLFPDLETNEFLAIGEIQQPEGADAESVVVSRADLEAFITRYGLDFGVTVDDPIETLVGKTFRALSPDNGTEFDERFAPNLNPDAPPPYLPPAEEFNPFDSEHQRAIPFREIVGFEDLGGGLIRLDFDVAWRNAFATGDEYALVNASPANFFAREEEQVDLMFVLDTDARSDEEGRLLFHTEEPVDQEGDPLFDTFIANRGQLTGLGMGEGATFFTGVDEETGEDTFVTLPGGILFDEIEMLDVALGSGNDSFVIEGTHSGATRLSTGPGDDEVEVWSVSGPTTIDGGPGSNVTHVGFPDDVEQPEGYSLAEIAALLTVGGDVPEALARTTVRGEPDVFAPDGSLIAQGSTNEQEIILNAGGGTFTLRFKGADLDPEAQPPLGQETVPLAYEASAEEIRDALAALDGLTDFEVDRFGDRIVIRFTETGAFAKTPMHVFGVSSAELTPAGTSTLNVRGTADDASMWALLTQSTLTGMGMPVFNAIQTIYVDDPQPRDPLRPFTLSFEGDEATELDATSSAAEVQAALEALDSIGTGNVAVSKVDKVYVVRFQGELTNQVVPTLSSTDSHVHIAVREPGIDPLDDQSIPPSADSLARNDLQTLTIDATGGSFTLSTLGQETGPLAYNATAAEVADALQRLLPDRFADDIAVTRIGNAYHILFQGLTRTVMGGPGVGFLQVDQDVLEGTATLATRMDGINYYYINELNVEFGPAEDAFGHHVLNVQGTTADVTNIHLNAGDDRIFISSDADLDHDTWAPEDATYGFDFLTGHLDDILGDLNIDAGKGRHLLMVSDEATALAKGFDEDPVTIRRVEGDFEQPEILEDVEIELLNWAGGAIRYGAAPGEANNFFDGITLWGGAEGNSFDVQASHFRVSDDWRTVTTLNTGLGDDLAWVDLSQGVDGFFALNAQDGADWIDASASDRPLVLFGGQGDDTVYGGQGGDLVFGDQGRVIYLDPDTGEPATVLGHGGTYDYTDGQRLPPAAMFSVDPESTGNNRIFAGSGEDVIVGGFGDNWVHAGAGDDVVLGDGAWVEFVTDQGRVGLDGILPNYIESVFDTDQLEGADGASRARSLGIDPRLGDLGGLIPGGQDVLLGGDGDDVVIGGSHSDVIDGDDGRIDRFTGELEDLDSEERNRDLVIGDNVALDRRGSALDDFRNPRFRALTGSQIYNTAQNQTGQLQINRNAYHADPDWDTSPPAWADWLIDLHDGMTGYAGEPVADQAPPTFGDNYIAGGLDDDMIFGQRGEDTIQGDGSIFFDVWAGDWVDLSDYDPETFELVLTPRPEQPDALPRSFEATDDGDDYIEGGVDDDVIFGNLGQNDIIGGSSDLFGLAEPFQRDSSGANIIFGGAGTRIDRNDPGFDEDGSLIAFEDRHARNATVMLGDNGNIFRLTGTGGVNSGANLTFNYDANDPTRGDLRIKARGVELLDYTLGGSANVGAGDLMHGESGDDIMFGMTGDDVMFGHAGDDLMIAGMGHDWISGGTGDDGILGDDGLIFISRNSSAYGEPLYGIAAIPANQLSATISTPGNIQRALINVAGETKHTARLFGSSYTPGGNDIIYGGLGHDSIHTGAGNDAASGAEALPGYFTGELNWLMEATQGTATVAPQAWFYGITPYNPGDILQYQSDTTWFKHLDQVDPLRLLLLDAAGIRVSAATAAFGADGNGNLDFDSIQWSTSTGAPAYDFFLNFNPLEGPLDTRFPSQTPAPTDGDDVIFGNLGNNWIVGGTGRDHLWGGFQGSVLNADDNHLSTFFAKPADRIANDVEDPFQSYSDVVFGGAGRDFLIGNTGADRMIDWLGEFNTYVVPFNPFGGQQIHRETPQPNLQAFLLALSRADGADQVLGLERGGTAARQGEPRGEIGLVTSADPEWQAQSGGPAQPTPKQYPGQRILFSRLVPGDSGTGAPGGGSGGTATPVPPGPAPAGTTTLSIPAGPSSLMLAEPEEETAALFVPETDQFDASLPPESELAVLDGVEQEIVEEPDGILAIMPVDDELLTDTVEGDALPTESELAVLEDEAQEILGELEAALLLDDSVEFEASLPPESELAVIEDEEQEILGELDAALLLDDSIEFEATLPAESGLAVLEDEAQEIVEEPHGILTIMPVDDELLTDTVEGEALPAENGGEVGAAFLVFDETSGAFEDAVPPTPNGVEVIDLVSELVANEEPAGEVEEFLFFEEDELESAEQELAA